MESMTLSSGSSLQGGKYRIVRVLGQGGFGITYEAEQVSLGRRVAVKEFFMKDVCNRDGSTSHVSVPSVGSRELVEKFRQKFLREARMIASMKNPHIVRIYDVFEENGTAYYVMEYLSGGSLQQVVRNSGRLKESVALACIREAADALGYIHLLNTLHLDVKPSNLMLDEEGNVVLIDFGISKHYDESGSQTSSTPVGISKGFAPLEQYKQGSDIKSFTPATDIYALGATLYALLTGTNPPEAPDVNDDGLPIICGVSSVVMQAIECAMQPRRKDRPQSVAAFLQLLDDEGPRLANDEGTLLIGAENQKKSENMERLVAQSERGPYGPAYGKIATENFTVGGVTFAMLPVAGGTFTMGATAEMTSPDSDEKPTHQVTLSNYRMGETEVTQALWKAVMGSNPSHFKGDDLPVEKVSWNDCQTFLTKLNALTGRTFRLPTEAEWEYAARGGSKSRGTQYSGSSNLDEVAWYSGNSGRKTHAVKTKKANELGLYDMNGNVWEWCQDWYGSYRRRAQTNPTGPASGSYRVGRGGCWGDDARNCRSSYRCYDAPGFSYFNLGFRLALSE